jgi:dimethylglycine dehydrogenase
VDAGSITTATGGERRARIAIVGGGVAGCSLAFHLAERGRGEDAVLVEQHELTSGSTWHAAGLCTQLNASYNLMELLRYSVELYATLEERTGQAVDFHRTGSLRLATTRDRLDQFHHHAGMARSLGIPFEIVGPAEARALFPLLDTTGVIGAAYLPTDGHVDPTSLANAFAAGAAAAGVTVLRHSPVSAVDRDGDAWRLRLPESTVVADVVVNAAGQWAPQVARLSGFELPIVSLRHQYVVTADVPQLDGLPRELPVLRDPDGSFYVRQEGRGLLVGPFERRPLTWADDGIPDGFHGKLLPPSLEQIEDVLAAAAERLPAFGDAGIRTVVNGPDAYTPDGRCLMGPVGGVPSYHVLAGFSIFGVVFAGGAGRFAAEWILDGQPSWNMWDLDVRRFGPYAASRPYVAARACEVYEREYAIHFPHEELPAGRPLKTSPLYERLAERGAVYGARFGWERPVWFARDGAGRDEDSFRRSNWHGPVGEECRAVRDAVGVLDQTSFAKFEVSGPGAERFLDRLCANTLPAQPGRMRLTQMCTPSGGIECDVTVTRLAGGRFYVVSAAATETHDLEWMQRHLPADGTVRIENATERVGVLTIAGPRSRELLAAVTREDVSREAFPFFTARELRVGTAPARAMRVSYVGELGYELHLPVEHQLAVYERLLEAGGPLGLRDFGYRALESMRLEKGYRLWGADMSADYTPLEAGLGRFVALGKGDFVGADALRREAERGSTRRLACLVVDADDADAYGFEPVLSGERIVGYVASGGYGHRVERSIAYAYLPVELVEPGTRLAVDVLGERRAATVAREPLYDPANERLLS